MSLKNLLIPILMFLIKYSAAQSRLTAGQQVPSFKAIDSFGYPVSDSVFTGKKTYFSFQRNVGCPVCNLYVHHLLLNKELLAKNNIQVVLIYESGREALQMYLKEENYPFTFIADPENKLYQQFAVEKSAGKILKGIFHGAMRKVMQGKKLYRNRTKMDGDKTTIEAGFLVGPDKKILRACYGKYLGDQLSIEEIIESF